MREIVCCVRMLNVVSFHEFKNIHDEIERFMLPLADLSYWQTEYISRQKLCPVHISVDEIIMRNSKVFVPCQLEENKIYSLLFEVDKQLSNYFPIIGQGTEALVFNIGNGCVLKRRVSDGRIWECELRDMAHSMPGMYADEIPIGTSSNGDYDLEIQELLLPIDADKNRQLIEEHWFSSDKMNVPQFTYWEWGIDTNGIPHVFDWN